MTDQASPATNPYDLVPYEDHPYPPSHVRHLETMARLFNMQPADITHCRVLELGCAAGGNLLPQAEDLPDSTFLGVDLSERQIDKACQTVADLGSKNIEFRAASILDIDDSWGQFDYIISHGVFSWLPPEVQEGLLAVSARNLAPNGVAYVSYNTYPGWHLANVVRDVMRYHTAQFSNPEKQIEQAMAMLEFLVELGTDDRPATQVLREEFNLLKRLNNQSYLFHEHLEAENHPVYFYQFMERAQAYGLQYLAEPRLSLMLLKNMPPQAQEKFQRLDLLRREQYMDFVRGQRFRMTLLCHRDQVLNRTVTPDRMKGFSFAAAGPLQSKQVDIRNDSRCDFVFGAGTLTTGHRVTKAAMVYLDECRPRYVPFRQLLLTSAARVGPSLVTAGSLPEEEQALAANLLLAYSVDAVKIAVHPSQVVTQLTACPVASRLARLQAARGPCMTNRNHESVRLNALTRRLVHRLDGSHDRRSLIHEVEASIRAGEFQVTCKNQSVEHPGPVLLKQILDAQLSNISASALLVG